jgi:ABC-type nitrate/sulfonate/bicarbonate transport system permease component
MWGPDVAATGTSTSPDIAPPAPRRARAIARVVVRRVAVTAAALAAGVALWEGVIQLFDIAPYFMPGPEATLRTLVEARGELLAHARVTLLESAAGIAVSTLLATALAMVFVSSSRAERALLPLAITLRSIPIVAVAPLITLFAGRGFKTAVICVTIVSFFPILVNMARGFRALSSEVRELFLVCGGTKVQLFRYARFPVTIPYLFAGLRNAAAVAVLGAMLAEWLTGVEGLGFLVVNAAAVRDSALLWAAVIVSTALALGLFWATQAAERVSVAWAKGMR